jgi:hypothetical protein
MVIFDNVCKGKANCNLLNETQIYCLEGETCINQCGLSELPSYKFKLKNWTQSFLHVTYKLTPSSQLPLQCLCCLFSNCTITSSKKLQEINKKNPPNRIMTEKENPFQIIEIYEQISLVEIIIIHLLVRVWERIFTYCAGYQSKWRYREAVWIYTLANQILLLCVCMWASFLSPFRKKCMSSKIKALWNRIQW